MRAFTLVSTDPAFPMETRVFEGTNQIVDMLDAMQNTCLYVTKLLDVNIPHDVPREEAQRMCREASKCYLCDGLPTVEDPFVLVST